MPPDADILAEAARQLRLAKQGQTWRQIAVDSGLGAEWLRKIAAERIPNPGIRSVERLVAYLSGQRPPLALERDGRVVETRA